MSILSLYSKIQLKIKKAEGELKKLTELNSEASELSSVSFARSSALKLLKKTAVKTAWKLQLLFWKTLKTVIRFYALLFNDSSENFLMFASEMGYAKEVLEAELPIGSSASKTFKTVPKNITFICNNSYCQYKRFQKKVRFYSKTAFAGILICTIITSSVLYLFMPGKPSGLAATFNWVQTSWSGGADTVNFPVHPGNQTGWNKYYEKDAYVDDATPGEIKLSQTSDSWTETSDTDFNAGTKTDTAVSGTGDAADVILSPSPATFTDSFTDTSKIASSNNMNFDTANGLVKITYVSPGNIILRPNGAGDYTNALPEGAPFNWDAVNDITADDATSNVFNTYISGSLSDVYNLEDATPIVNVQQVAVYIRGHIYNINNGYFSSKLRLGTNEILGSSQQDVGWATHSEILSRPGGGSWNWTDINNLQGGIILDSGYAGASYVTQLYVKVYYSGYFNTSTFTSTNLLSGQSVGPISSFSYNLSALPSGTTAQVSFSQDNTNWFNSAGTASGRDTMSAGNNTISLTALNWTGANFYYKMEWTSDGTDTPVLDEVSVHTNYPSSGTYISSAHDTGIDNPTYLNFSWSNTLPITPVYLNYRKAITLNNSGSALTDYQILATLDTAALISAGKMRSDCGDIRFVDGSGNLFNYWLESGCNTSSTRIWIKVSSVPSGASAIYFLYGNSSASSASNGVNTFEFFDDFSGASKWTASGTGTYGTSGEGYVAASQTGTGAKTETLTTTNAIGTGTFKATMRIKNPAPTQETGTSYSYALKETTTSANLYVSPTDNNASYVSKTYTLTSVTNAKLQLYASATGNTTDGSCFAEGGYNADCEYFFSCADCSCVTIQQDCIDLGAIWTSGTTYTASASIYIDDVYVRKYTASEPIPSLGSEESGNYFGGGTSVKFQIRTASTEEALSSTAWYDSSFNYRKAITITENSSSTLTNYQVKITVSYDSDMQADFDDIRFTDSDGATLIDHWLESKTNSTTADFWVEIPSLAASSAKTIYMYYGNSSATSQSNGANTFEFFDDFEGVSLDAGRWPTIGDAGSYSVSGGLLTMTNPKYIGSATTYTDGYAMRTRASAGIDTVGETWVGFYTTVPSYSYKGRTLNWYYGATSVFLFNSSNGTSGQLIYSDISLDAAYHITEARRATGADIFQMDNETEKTGLYPTSIARYISIYAYSADIVVDWILVRKYMATEPTASLGGEEPKTSSIATGWRGPTGTNDYYTTSATAINSVHNGQRWVQYKAILETTDSTQTPALHSATMTFGMSSTLTSSPYDASDSGEVINQIVWTETAPTDTNVKFQMRTAPESSGTYTIWMGPDGTAGTYFDNDSSGCSKTGNDVTCDILNTLDISDGALDRWLQYKVWLTSSTAETPVLQNVSIQYVVNATPVVSNITASQGTDGVISISYDLSDADSSSFTVSALADIGITLNEELTSSDATAITVSDGSLLPSSGTIQIDNEQISYTSKSGNNLQGTVTRGANNTKALSHSSGTAVWIKGSAVSGDIGASQTAGTGKSISWTIKTDLDGVYYAAAKIRVAANDGNVANQVGNGDSAAFVLDAKDVVLGTYPILIDASAGLDSATLTLDATDDTALEMKLSNSADLSADGVNSDSGTWISYASSKSWILSTDPDTLYVQFKDSKGNTTATQSLESLLTPEYFMIQDTSNLDAGEFREFVAWKVSVISNFQDYIVESSTDNIAFSNLTTITDQALNYYTHASLTQDQDYYYQVYQQDTLGNKSPRATAKHGNANGAQDYDEGGGGTAAGTDTTAPTITHDYSTQVTSITSTTAIITFTTNEMSDSYIGYSTDTGYGNEQGVPTMIAGGEAHAVTLIGLAENTTYHYKIKSRDASDNVGTSQDDTNYTFTTITDITAPVITFSSSTDITSITDSSAVISWTTDEAATSRVDYGTSVLYGSNETNANYNINHSISLSSLLPSTTYYFKITSVDNSISANSATDDNSTAGYTFTTLASSDTIPPVISVVSSGTPSYNTATISWTTDENSNSLVDFGTSVSYGSTQGNSADSTTSHSVVLTGLASETTYYYRVKSMDISGNTAIDDNSEAGYTFLTIAAPTPGDTTAPVISSVFSSSVTSTGATITWTTDESSDSTVGFSLDTSFDQEQGSTTAATSHSITLVNLAPETTYYYQIKSRDGGGNLGTDNNSGAGYSFTTLAGGDGLAPIISNVTISDLTANTAKITWTTNENSNSLIDYSATSGIFTSTQGKYQDNTITHSVTLTGLDPSTAYYIQARSADASGNEGKDSNGGEGYTFTTTGGGDETPPEITNIVAGTPTYNSVVITWTTNELSNSLIDFGTTTSYGVTQGNSADSVTSHSVALTGLSPSTAYYYRVKSIDVSGNLISDDNSGSGYTFTTAAGLDPGDTTAPTITFNSETGITNITSNSATIAWTTDESSDSTIGYSLDTSFNSEKGSATLTSNHSVALTNLSSGTAYKLQIKSMDGSGNLATENNSGAGYTFTTLAGGDSTAPIITNVASGTCADTTCAITWTTDENSSSLVDYGTVLGTYTSTGGNYKASVTSHAVTLTGLTAGTAYYYRARSIDANNNQAIDAGGASGYSFTTAAAAASDCPTCSCGSGGGSCPSVDTNPPTISNVKVSEITINSAMVKWETNEEGYSITEYGIDNSYGGIAGLYNNSVKIHSIKLSGLESEATYHYRVASADSSGNLAQSEDFTFKTLSFEEITSEEQKEQIEEQQEIAAVEIQAKLEELLNQGMDEETVRSIIAKATQPPSIATEGPIVENITNSSAKIIWTTDRKSNSVIRFKIKEEGVDPETSLFLKQYGNFKELTIEHQVILGNLQSGTAYQYQVQSSDILGNTGKSEWREFTTEMTPSIYDVIVSEITLNSAVISWKTNVVSTSKIEYGETINYTESAEDKDLAKVAKHSIKLNNLKSGTAYHFRVRGIGNEGSSLVSDDYNFTTFTLPQIETYRIEEIGEKTIKLSWKTNVETDSILKYTDLETNTAKTQGEDEMSSIHDFTLKGLNPGIEYLLQIQGRDIYGNQAITSEFAATTLADSTPPQITQVRAETAVSSGKSDVVQTIVSWKTSEPATSQILWEEGISEDSIPKNATPEDENYTTNHIMVITTFKPASVYRFRVQGKDKSDNSAQSQDFTILIPEKKKSVIQIIISNFEDTFGWIKKIGL